MNEETEVHVLQFVCVKSCTVTTTRRCRSTVRQEHIPRQHIDQQHGCGISSNRSEHTLTCSSADTRQSMHTSGHVDHITRWRRDSLEVFDYCFEATTLQKQGACWGK